MFKILMAIFMSLEARSKTPKYHRTGVHQRCGYFVEYINGKVTEETVLCQPGYTCSDFMNNGVCIPAIHQEVLEIEAEDVSEDDLEIDGLGWLRLLEGCAAVRYQTELKVKRGVHVSRFPICQEKNPNLYRREQCQKVGGRRPRSSCDFIVDEVTGIRLAN